MNSQLSITAITPARRAKGESFGSQTLLFQIRSQDRVMEPGCLWGTDGTVALKRMAVRQTFNAAFIIITLLTLLAPCLTEFKIS